MEVGKYLAPFRCPKTSIDFKGETSYEVITFSPSNAKAGDVLYVDFPKLKDQLVIPGTFSLTFDLKIELDPATPGKEVKNYPVNNLASNILSRICIKIGSETVFDLDYSYLYNTYKDLWLSSECRNNLVFEGIQDEQLRKMRADLKAELEAAKLTNIQMRNTFGKRYRLPINFEMISNHMPLSGELFDSKLTFELTLSSEKYVLNYETSGIFQMHNICLEFETIKYAPLYRSVETELIEGSAFLYDHVHHYKREEISKSATLVNLEITGLNRKSLKGILLIFEDEFEAGKRDSEHFVNPAIKDVKYTIDDLPNKYYSQGYSEQYQWREISKHFLREDQKLDHNSFMNLVSYYSAHKFALWTDLRSTEDNNLHGSGKYHKDKIHMEIKKNAGGTGKHIMHVFIISDARIIIRNKKLLSCDK